MLHPPQKVALRPDPSTGLTRFLCPIERDKRKLAELESQIELVKARLAELSELRSSLLEGSKPLLIDDVLDERDD